MSFEGDYDSEVERALREGDMYSEDDDSIDDPTYKLPKKHHHDTIDNTMADDASASSPTAEGPYEQTSGRKDAPKYREASIEGQSAPVFKKKFPRLRTFVTGGEGAMPRPITAELNSDDEIILDMKDKGYRNEEIRERLIKEDRVTYNAKTIETRYARLKRQIRYAQEKKLDQDFSDWHEDEDEKLLAIHNSSTLQKELEERLARAKDSHYREIASAINRDRVDNGKEAKYSRHAVRDRIEMLLGNTSTHPAQEADPQAAARRALVNLKQSIDATVRAKQLEEDRAEREEDVKREQERIAFAEELKRQEELEKQKRMTERAKSAAEKKADAQRTRQKATEERQRRIEHNKKLKEAADAERERKRAKRAAREFALENAKLEKAAKLKYDRALKLKEQLDKQAAELAQMKIDNRRANILRRHMRKCGMDVNAALDGEESDKEDVVEHAPKRKRGRPSNMDLAKRYGMSAEVSSDDSEAGNDTLISKNAALLKDSIPSNSPSTPAAKKSCIVAGDPTKNPRIRLDVIELRSLLRSRELSEDGDKNAMVMRLQAADLSSKYNDLIAECKRRNILIRGNKAEQAWRIADDDVKRFHLGDSYAEKNAECADNLRVSDGEEGGDEKTLDIV